MPNSLLGLRVVPDPLRGEMDVVDDGEFLAAFAEGRVPVAASGVVIAANAFAAGSIARLLAAILADLPLSAKAFGAVGDGVTDDTAALQLWLDRVLATRRRGYLPRGKYKTTARLTVEIADATKWAGGIVLEGETPGFSQDGTVYGSVIAPTSAVTGAALDISGIANGDNSNKGQINGLEVVRIGFLGTGVGQAIRLKYFTNVEFRNVHVYNFATGFKIERQVNGATYGYGLNLVFNNCFTAVCTGYGLDMVDAGSVLASVNNCNFTVCAWAIKAAGAPLNIIGGYIGGGTTGGVWLTKPTDSGSRNGLVRIAGVLFETNGTSATGTYATDTCQILIDASTQVSLEANEFLGGLSGSHSVKAGFGADVCAGIVARGNKHWGKGASVANQRAFLLGDNCERAEIHDKEIQDFAGVTGRTEFTSAIRGQTNGGGYALAAGCILSNALAITNQGGVGNIFTISDMPLRSTLRVDVRSQGGAIWAAATVTRSDTTTIVVRKDGSSADCDIGLVGSAVQVTNNLASPAAPSATTFYWSAFIARTK